MAQFLDFRPDEPSIVLALPRGGIPVAAPIAEALDAEFTAVLARKLPIPDSPEMGFGAVAIDGSRVINEAVVYDFRISESQVDRVAEQVNREVRRRAEEYVGSDSPPDVNGKHAFMVDDGLATGYSMLAAVKMVRKGNPLSVTLCVPVSPIRSIHTVEEHFDRVYCLAAQERSPFAVASFYADFHDLSDEEVIAILEQGEKAKR